MPSTHHDSFIDRHEAVSFFRYLCETKTEESAEEARLAERLEETKGFSEEKAEAIARAQTQRQQLFPILTFLAPGGGGKSTLINHLRDHVCRHNGEAVLPYAHLDFAQPDAPRDLFPILIALRNQLHHLKDRHGKQLIFPRFDLGAAIASIPPVGIARSYVENDLGEDLVVRVAERLREENEVQPVVEWYRYELALPSQADAHLGEMISMLRASSEPGNPERQRFLDQVLPAAFLADLRHGLAQGAYSPTSHKAWSHTTPVVLFLDGFEFLLESFGSDDPEIESMGYRLLQTLTEHHKKEREPNPLLIVIGSNQRLFNLESPDASFSVEQESWRKLTIEERTEVRYKLWEEFLPAERRYASLNNLYLAWWLDRFDREETRGYLLAFGAELASTLSGEAWVRTIYRLTSGHPISLKLAVIVLLEASRRGQALSIEAFERTFLEMHVPISVAPDHQDETISEYLRVVLLSQVPRSEWDTLSFFSLSRTLNADTLQAVAQLPSDSEAEVRLRFYRRLTIMQVLDEGRVIFHPVVRSHLLQDLQPSLDDSGDYYEKQRALYEYYHSRVVAGDEQARREEVYHALALGNPEPAIELALLGQKGAVQLEQEVRELVGHAPTQRIPQDAKQRAHDALMRAWRPIDNDDGDEGAGDEISEAQLTEIIRRNAITAIVLYTWLLAASGRDVYENTYLLRKLGEAYLSLPEANRRTSRAVATAYLEKAVVIHERVTEVTTVEVATVGASASVPMVEEADVKITEVEEEEVERTEVKKTEVEKTVVDVTQVEETEEEATQVRLAAIKATEVQVVEAGAGAVGVIDVAATEVEAIAVKAIDVKTTEVRMEEVKETDEQIEEVRDTKVKVREIEVKVALARPAIAPAVFEQVGMVSVLDEIEVVEVEVEEDKDDSGVLPIPIPFPFPYRRRKRRRRARNWFLWLLIPLLLLACLLLILVLIIPAPAPPPRPAPTVIVQTTILVTTVPGQPTPTPVPPCGLPVTTPIGTTQTPDGQLIGISDGSSVFDVANSGVYAKQQAAKQLIAGNTAMATTFWQQAVANYANDAEGQIYLEDANVLASGKPYITFIVGTSFTPNSTIGRDFLQGALVAQLEHNMGQEFSLPGNTLVRLLIANVGDKPACANGVAQQIVQAVQADPTIKGVIGWTSVARSGDAIKTLTNAHIPVIEPVDATDSLTGFSPYLFRVSPINKSEAIVGANFAKQTLHAHNIALFLDLNDPYSSSLAMDFQQQFVDSTHSIVRSESYTAGSTNAQIMSGLLSDALTAVPPPDLIYFAGTSTDVDPLLAELPSSGLYAQLKVLGGNGLYQLSGYSVQSGANFNRLYLTAATYPDEWRILGKAKQTPVFFADYRQFFDPKHNYPGGAYGYGRPNSNVILAYDSMQAFLKGSVLVRKQNFTPADLQHGLTLVTGSNRLQGVSGQIAFGPGGNPINKAVLMLTIDSSRRLAMVPKVQLGEF